MTGTSITGQQVRGMFPTYTCPVFPGGKIDLINKSGFFWLIEALPTPDVYQGEVMEMLKEFTKNRDQEQRLDAPSLEYLEKEIQ